MTKKDYIAIATILNKYSDAEHMILLKLCQYFKEDNPNWKATKGDGKSIYDCENEPWCEPKEDEKSVRTYKKIYSDEHKAPEWIEIHIGPEWVEPNLRED